MTHAEAKAARSQLNRDFEQEAERHRKAIEELRNRTGELKKACPHEEVTFYSGSCYDPGGAYICETCKRSSGRDFGYNKPAQSRMV
jgi:hypothetical protein